MSWSPLDEAEQVMVLPDTASLQEIVPLFAEVKNKLVLITARSEETSKASIVLIKPDLLYFVTVRAGKQR